MAEKEKRRHVDDLQAGQSLAAVQALDDLVHLDDVLLGHGLVDQFFFKFLARLQLEVARLVVFVAAEIRGEVHAGALEQLAGQRGAAARMPDDENAVLQDDGPYFFLCFRCLVIHMNLRCLCAA